MRLARPVVAVAVCMRDQDPALASLEHLSDSSPDRRSLRRRGSRVVEQRRLGAEQEVQERRRDGDRLALADQERRAVGRPVYPSRRRQGDRLPRPHRLGERAGRAARAQLALPIDRRIPRAGVRTGGTSRRR
jgi:hypothetical protein